MSLEDARLHVARRLESDAWSGPVPRALSALWATVAARRIARPLEWPGGVNVIAVGGATLGGSGRTPLAIAVARAIAVGGGRVALVAHGYRADPGSPRVVEVDDGAPLVGDEALVAARALRGLAPVVVARTRSAAVAHAATLADTLVLDGVLQTTPRRASLALLALDASSPWGSGHVPPCGDLRAAPFDLLLHADRAVLLRDELASADRRPLLVSPYDLARVVSRGAHVGDRLIPFAELAPLRLGLFTALARPSRVLASLARRGVIPAARVTAPDHARVSRVLLARRLAAARVDLWLATPKCATHLAAHRLPHATIDHDVVLADPLVRALRAAASAPPARATDLGGNAAPLRSS